MALLRWSLIFAMAMAVTLGAAHAQTLYKSVDASGKTVYSDKPPISGSVEKTMKLENLPVSVVPGYRPPPASLGASPPSPPVAQSRGEATLYMATWCGYCKAAKAYLAEKKISYRELDIDTPAGKTAFAPLGVRGVPLLLANGQRVSGFNAQAYDAVFAAQR